MEKIIDNNKCCGCHACFNACPKDAIEMVEDEKGFKYPTINQNKCINCGLCKKVCPIYNSNEEQRKIESYASYNKNIEDRMNSSSGGIFILLAKEIIKRNGIVFGACFDIKFNVVHSFCEKEKELTMFMGAKYVQSTIGETYKKAKEFLEKGRFVLFTGTPCQIEGLKSYLRKDYDNLYTQDIICHGVPSPKLWKKYLEFQKKHNNDQIQEISFRNKEHGWAAFRTKISFKSKTYSESFNNDLYMKAFLNNVCLRNSCYNCSFKKMYRNSDITLADYWGIQKIHPDMYDDKGISLVVINSKKGKELFDAIKESIIYKETSLNRALKYNIAMIKSANYSPNEQRLFANIDTLDMDKLVKKYVPHPKLSRKIKNTIKKIINKY